MARKSSAPKKFKPNKVQRNGSKRKQAAGQTAPLAKAVNDIVYQLPSDSLEPFEESSASPAQKRDTEKASEAEDSGIKMLAQGSEAHFDNRSTTSSAEICPGTPFRENLSPRHSDISTSGSQTETSSCDGVDCTSDKHHSTIYDFQARDDTTPTENSAQEALQFPASSNDLSPVALTPALALPRTSSSAVPPTLPPDSTSANEFLDEALCTAEHQEGLSSAASESLVDMGPILAATASEEHQLNADSNALTDCPPVPLTPPMDCSSTSQAQDEGKQAADSAVEWPRGLTGWALLLCGRLQAKTPTAVRPLVNVAVAATVEVLAATAALSAIRL